jgi:hypothetical protein
MHNTVGQMKYDNHIYEPPQKEFPYYYQEFRSNIYKSF